MSRELKTLMVLLLVAVALSAAIFYRNGWPPFGATTAGFLIVGALWGATTVGLAALWSLVTRKAPNIVGAFNVGFVVFLAVQLFAEIAYQHSRPGEQSTATTPVSLDAGAAGKETK